MRVLHVYSGNLFGGIETILATIARRKRGAAHEFALCFEARLSGELRSAGAQVHALRPVTFRRPHSVQAARRDLRALLRTQRFDRVICHAPWTMALFGDVVRREAQPLVFWAHDEMTGRHWTERLARRVPPDLVICNSHFTRRTMDAMYRDAPAAVVYAPVEPPPAAALDRSRIRASLATAPEAVVLVTACRSEAWKGHELLIDALADMRDVPQWIWWQLGGTQRPREASFLHALRERASASGIADRIRWAGERADVRHVLAAADVYCQPNLRPEPFGIAFIEALWAGLPVVTTRHGGGAEIVDETCGLLVPPGNRAALSEALRDLVLGDARRFNLGRGGTIRARRLCDPDAQLALLEATLTELGVAPTAA